MHRHSMRWWSSVGLAIAVALAVSIIPGCSKQSPFPEYLTPQAAASDFVVGVLEGDAGRVSGALGHEVSDAQVAQWREGEFLIDGVLTDVHPQLGVSYVDEQGASLVLEGVTASGVELPADDEALGGVVVFVHLAPDGWRVLEANRVTED